jgi:hypothetical protein
VKVTEDRITDIQVLRGAPCGATWEAALRILSLPVKEALVRIGLDVQYYCSADPAGWDPVHGKSPVHVAGKIHQKALKAALGRVSKKPSEPRTKDRDKEDV